MTNLQEQKRYQLDIQAIKKMPGDVFQIGLSRPDNLPLSFYAGQYLILHRPGKEDCAYSIASSPVSDSGSLELHIQCYSDSPNAVEVIDYLCNQKTVEVTLPLGNCYINKDNIPDSPLVFIAAATGFSQMKSMIEYVGTTDHQHGRYLYWGVRRPQGFYLPDLPALWVKKQLIEYHPIVSHAEKEDKWLGRFGMLYEAVIADCARFDSADFYIGGSPQMVHLKWSMLRWMH